MRCKIFVLFFFIYSLSLHSFSQCNPDVIFTSIGLPGVYPPSVQIPAVPLPLGISDGQLGSNYNQTLTMVILEDTTLDIAPILQLAGFGAAVTAMNTFNISTVMTVDVNYAAFDVQGLPNGLSYQCDISNCEYPSSVDGCMNISGVPTESGTFTVPVNMIINIQIPSIANPLPGQPPIFSGMGVDLPSIEANQYDLYISDGPTYINDEINEIYNLFPNPTNSRFTLQVDSPKFLEIYNANGECLFHQKVNTSIDINKSEIGEGIFIMYIYDKNSRVKKKLIVL